MCSEGGGCHIRPPSLFYVERVRVQRNGSPFSDLQKFPLLRTTICPCGESVLHEFIQPGTVYSLDMSTRRGGFTYRCGRCGVEQPDVQVVKASQQLNPDLGMGWLPWGLFSEAEAA